MTIRAGFAKGIITPELPFYLAGYGVLCADRNAKYVKDDLYVSVISISNGTHTLVFISCDLISMKDSLNKPALEYLQTEHGIPEQNVIICATHTHTGPEIRDCLPEGQAYIDFQNTYNKFLQGRILEVVKAALENPIDATMHIGQSQAEDISFNRLYRCNDGSEVFGKSTGKKLIGAAGPVDPSVQTLSILGMDKKLKAVMINFACHPDIVGGAAADFVSSDWPGAARNVFESVYGKDTVCMVLQGAAGDINQNDYKEHYLSNGGTEKAFQVGRAVAGAAMLAVEKSSLDLVDTEKISTEMEYLQIPYTEITQEFRDYVKRLSETENLSGLEQSLVRNFCKWDKEGKVDKFPIKCLRIGAFAFAGMPGEIFTQWGLEIKKYSPAHQTFIVELCSSHDGLTGYKCGTDQALRGIEGRGGYGTVPTVSRNHRFDAGRLMTEAVIKNLHKLWV
jgi:hypothetical protein